MLSSDLQKLSVSGLVTLYELDATNLGAGLLRWHGHTSSEDWRYLYEFASKAQYASASKKVAPTGTEDFLRRDIVWQGQSYGPISIQTDGLEVRGDGAPSTPSLVLGNKLGDQPGAIGFLCAHHRDFVGAQLRVIRVLAKYLDARNFTSGNASADPSQFAEQFWIIEQKKSEDKRQVAFELSTPLTAQRKRIPARNITTYCDWAVKGKYRGESCGYTGAAMFTEDGKPTGDPALDKCGARLSDCKLRFGEHEPLNFGGFPSSNRMM